MRGKPPPYFSWVEEGLLAALGYPRIPEHIQFLQDQGIKYLVSLTPTKPDVENFPGNDKSIYIYKYIYMVLYRTPFSFPLNVEKA